jgi:hypothetical protein
MANRLTLSTAHNLAIDLQNLGEYERARHWTKTPSPGPAGSSATSMPTLSDSV